MSRPVSRLKLPAALVFSSVTLFAGIATTTGCSDDEAVGADCEDVADGECVACVDDDGDQSCAGAPGCFLNASTGLCEEEAMA